MTWPQGHGRQGKGGACRQSTAVALPTPTRPSIIPLPFFFLYVPRVSHTLACSSP